MKILPLLIDSSPSLLTSAAVVVGGRSCSVALERFSFTGAKLHELDRTTPVRAKSWDMDGILSFALEFAFQGRVDTPSRPVNSSPRTEHSVPDFLLALQMARKILPHIHKKTKFTAGNPSHERIANLVCTGVSISLPAFRWILMCDLIVAAFRTPAVLPPCRSKKSRRYRRPRIIVHTP